MKSLLNIYELNFFLFHSIGPVCEIEIEIQFFFPDPKLAIQIKTDKHYCSWETNNRNTIVFFFGSGKTVL